MRKIPEGVVLKLQTLNGCRFKGNWASNLIPKDLEQATRVLKERLDFGLSILPESPSELNTAKVRKLIFHRNHCKLSSRAGSRGIELSI